jgi:hypothetical protein
MRRAGGRPAELARQLQSATIDARFYGSLRQPQLVGDFLVRQLLEIAKHDRGPERSGQYLQGLPQQRAQILVLGDRVRPTFQRRRLQVAGIDIARDRLPLLPHAAVVIDAEVPADADDPGLEVRAAIERVQRLEDLEEDILREIFRLVVPPDELVGDVEDLAPVLAHDRLPRDLVTGQAPLDEAVGRQGLRRRGINRHVKAKVYRMFTDGSTRAGRVGRSCDRIGPP